MTDLADTPAQPAGRARRARELLRTEGPASARTVITVAVAWPPCGTNNIQVALSSLLVFAHTSPDSYTPELPPTATQRPPYEWASMTSLPL
ncbi:hypothetical protein [Streptomyces sp. NBC_01264]|uniref:hypothetical protein n=1 Tax=Streptomyces sp. NBC_01264 TaxID=2903804 RepID=UPI00224FAD60|nr:hypothetical protein [Streptomyces sp. NBC_01264]MCX4775682.1 hypothetical protein [Streptomyces sp. NBC_01264]